MDLKHKRAGAQLGAEALSLHTCELDTDRRARQRRQRRRQRLRRAPAALAFCPGRVGSSDVHAQDKLTLAQALGLVRGRGEEGGGLREGEGG
eukprot:359588-Chlamydomonas_euryale.AAC.5